MMKTYKGMTLSMGEKQHLDKLIMRYPMLKRIEEQLSDAFWMLTDSFQSGGKLLIAGNGGSSADSDHIVGELMKSFNLKRPLDKERYMKAEASLAQFAEGAVDMLQGALPAISLTQNTAFMTAYANDVNADLGFAQQLVGYGKPGDVFWGISTSGNAKNVNIAMRVARSWGMHTLGMTGEAGGQLKEACDICLCVPGKYPAEVQELHVPVYHTLCAMLESHFFSHESIF